MDKVILQIGENQQFVNLSRTITETGADPNTLFWKAINIKDLGIDIIKEEKAVFTVNLENETIDGLTHYPVMLVDLDFAPHSKIAEKIEGLKALRGLSPDGGGSGGSAGGVEVPTALSTEYKTGRTIDGREEFAQNFEYTHNAMYDMGYLSGVDMQTFSLPPGVAAADVRAKLTGYQWGNYIVDSVPLGVFFDKHTNKVGLQNFTQGTFNLDTLNKFHYVISYTKTA